MDTRSPALLAVHGEEPGAGQFRLRGSQTRASKIMVKKANKSANAAPRAKSLAARSDPPAVTEGAVLSEFARIAFSNVLDYLSQDETAQVTVDLAQLDRVTAAALQEVVVDTTTTGRGEATKTVRRTRVKLANKLAALAHLGKHLGLFASLPAANPYAEMSEADLRARAQEMIRALQDAGVDLGVSCGGDDAPPAEDASRTRKTV